MGPEPGKRERLAALLEGELDFHGEDSGYASHDLHAFAAKFPPQLPRVFIRGLTRPGEIVLDPMMGSGTTIVESMLEGRRAIGLDLDPLALRLSRVKTTPLAVDRLREAGQGVLDSARAMLSQGEGALEKALAGRFDKTSGGFVDYWFQPATRHELLALVVAIGSVPDISIRRFLELAFSSIIVTKSGGVSRARDLAHSRPHRVEGKVARSALDMFARRLNKNIASLVQLGAHGPLAVPLAGDARAMPIADGVVDLVVTSPPYANAIDYMRAHKFSLVWLSDSLAVLTGLRAAYIGSERTGGLSIASDTLPDLPEAIMTGLAERDRRKAVVLRKYFLEMRLVLAETYRVLRPDAAAVFVVGTSTMRGIDVQTHRCLAEIAASVRFEVVGIARRALDRNKRLMPARFGNKTDSMIEQRMHEEYVLGLYKRPSSRVEAG